jgi:hypothetical protein
MDTIRKAVGLSAIILFVGLSSACAAQLQGGAHPSNDSGSQIPKGESTLQSKDLENDIQIANPKGEATPQSKDLKKDIPKGEATLQSKDLEKDIQIANEPEPK